MEHTLETWYSNIKKSNLGLNSKVKKKFDKVDAIDNVSQIYFEDPEVERICHKRGVYTIDDAAKVSSIKGWFNKNNLIETFNELKLFTGLKTIEDEAFNYCEVLQTVTIPNSVSSIGFYAFYDCMSLQSITIPDGVTSIEDYAFTYCESLQAINIPNSVTSIGGNAFYNCRSLQTINISKNCPVYDQIRKAYSDIQLIDPKMNESSSLGLNSKVKKKFDKVDAIDNVAYIEFEDPEIERICHEHGVYTVDDADSVTSIKNWFSDNSYIKTFDELKYFTGLKTIEEMAFSFCNVLQSITIPNTVTSIGDRAFEVCGSLKSITIPDGVTSIEYGAFYRCTSLQSVIIPNSVANIKERAFRHCTALKTINIPDSVTSIEELVFYECSSLQSVIIPNSVTYIGGYTFYECSSLQSVIIPNSVTYIGERVFGRCRSLQSITIPDSVTRIGGRAFIECKALKAIYISKNCPVYNQVNDQIKEEYQVIQLIEPKVNESSSLGLNSKVKKKFNDVDTVDNIAQICFEDSEVERICHEHGVYTYEDAAKVTSIKFWFRLNDNIKTFNELRFFTGLKTIEDEAFANCITLQSVVIPNSVASIGHFAFYHCASLHSITIPDSVTSIGASVFNGCRSLQSITIPDSVTRIGDGVFNGCENLQSVTIPDGMTSIGHWAFGYCKSLQSITIPDGVTSIGKEAFTGCKSLKKVYMSSSCKAFKSIMSKIRKNSKDAIIIDPNNQKLLRRAGLVESVVRENKETNITNSQGQDVPEIGKHAENVYLPDCPFMIGKEQVDWFEYFQREKEKHTIKDVDDFIESAKKDTSLIKESNVALGLNKKVQDKFNKNEDTYRDDINDSIANDLLENEEFYKEIDNFVESLKMATGNFDHDVTFGRGRVHRTYCIEREVFKDDMKHHIYLSLRSYDLRDFSEYKNSFDISICIESHAGFALHHEWNLNRKSYKKFDKFFDELSESVEFPRNEKNVYFKTTKRALEQVKKFIEMFCTHNLYIWKNSLRKEADRAVSMGMDISTKFINYTSRDVKRMMMPILDEIPSLPSEYQH